MSGRYMTVASCARIIGMTARQVRNLIYAGEIDAVDLRMTGGQRAQWRVCRESLMTLLNSRRRGKERGNTGK